MGTSFGGSMIAAFEAGQRVRRNREQFAQETEERKLRMDAFRSRLAREKLMQNAQDVIKQRDLNKETLEALANALPDRLMPGISRPATPRMTEPAPAGGLPVQHSPVPGLNLPESLLPEIKATLPGFNTELAQAPDLPVILRSMAERQRLAATAERSKKLNELVTTHPGESVGFPGEPPLISRPETPAIHWTTDIHGNPVPVTAPKAGGAVSTPPGFVPVPPRDFAGEQETNRRFQAEQNALNRASRAEAARIAAGAKPATAAALRVASFYYRMQDAINSIESKPAPGRTSLEEEITGMGTLGQIGLQYLPNLMQTEPGQLYRQAQRQFTEARLRKDSGAAIRDEEYEQDAKIYFAQPGDTTTTLKRKQSARQNVLAVIRREAGKAVEEGGGSGQGGRIPQVGEIRKGYRFKGGDPAEQQSWEKVQ